MIQQELKFNTKDIKVVYDLTHKPTEIVIKYNKFLELLNLIEDKQIEKKLLARIKDEEIVDESEIFDV